MKLFILIFLHFVSVFCSSDRPNVVVFLVDDLGFNDLGYNGHTTTQTPFIDNLAQNEGLILLNHFVYDQCCPTRASFLTGRYPTRYGLQTYGADAGLPYGLSLSERLLVSEFKDVGYQTHIFGKWHLGMPRWEYTPTYRDFDSFYGYYGGEIDYWNHSQTITSDGKSRSGYDFRAMEETSSNEDYSLLWARDHLLATLKKIYKGDDEKPFFLYVAWQASHSPSEAPESYLLKYPNSTLYTRQALQAQTTLLDDCMNDVVTTMKEYDLWDNTLVLFASDNGAVIDCGDNFPLRGGKATVWNGALHTPAFVTGGYLSEDRKGKTLDSIFIHVTDWYKTLTTAVGVPISGDASRLDGLDVWDAIQYGIYNTSEYERETLLFLSPVGCSLSVCGAMQFGDFKLIVSNDNLETASSNQTCYWVQEFAINTDTNVLGCDSIEDAVYHCDCSDKPCLFNIRKDACEMYNIASEYPQVVDYMYNRLLAYNESQFEALGQSVHVNWTIADPSLYDGFWTPYMTSELKFESDILIYLESDVSDERNSKYWAIANSLKQSALQEIFEKNGNFGTKKTTKKNGSSEKQNSGKNNHLEKEGNTDENNHFGKQQEIIETKKHNNNMSMILIISGVAVITIFLYMVMKSYFCNKYKLALNDGFNQEFTPLIAKN